MSSNLLDLKYFDYLVSTSTLAQGVNLPAYLVIIKNTRIYRENTYREYNINEIRQMIGRAGRKQVKSLCIFYLKHFIYLDFLIFKYSNEGKVVIMTNNKNKVNSLNYSCY